MKKRFILPIIFLTSLILVLSLISALNIQVEKESNEEVLIYGTNQPAVFNLKITNLGSEVDYLEFYNLLGFQMFPVGTVQLNGHETKNVELKISPIGKFDYRGWYTMEYYIRGKDSSEIKLPLSFKIVELKDVFEVGTSEFDPASSTVKVYLYNKVNYNFNNLETKFSSSFFNFEEKISLEPYKKKEFSVNLNKEDFKKLIAGTYPINAEVKFDNRKTSVEGLLKFIEKDIVTTSKKEYGLIVQTQTIEKANEGNVVTKTETVLKKNIISRLFTSFNPDPDSVERQGFNVYYSWSKTVKPGETFKIVVKTNWLIPELLILLIVIVIVLVKITSRTNLELVKSVSFVRAKGGEFALKVNIEVTAKKYLEKIHIIDRLPPLVSIYERFGGIPPSKVDDKGKKLEWNFERLEAGEKRILSYVAYSKVGVLGKFSLPATTAIFHRNGEVSQTESNRAFLITDQVRKDAE